MKKTTSAELYNVMTPNGGEILKAPRSNAIVFSVLQEMNDQKISTKLKVNETKKISFLYPDHSDEYSIKRIQ